jgi:hypothetical protein
MSLKRRLAAFAAVTTALAVGGSVPSGGAATSPGTDPVVTGPSCPEGYSGPTNLATGCPYWMMSYRVEYPGQLSLSCPVTWSPPADLGDADAAMASGVFDGCSTVPTA